MLKVTLRLNLLLEYDNSSQNGRFFTLVNTGVAPCKGIQDNLTIRFWIPRRGFRILIAGLCILCQWNFAYFGFQSLEEPGFLELYSGFHKDNFLDSGIRIPLHRATVKYRKKKQTNQEKTTIKLPSILLCHELTIQR